ncbi:unnamed protein product, partial [Ixodes pacificus]
AASVRAAAVCGSVSREARSGGTLAASAQTPGYVSERQRNPVVYPPRSWPLFFELRGLRHVFSPPLTSPVSASAVCARAWKSPERHLGTAEQTHRPTSRRITGRRLESNAEQAEDYRMTSAKLW